MRLGFQCILQRLCSALRVGTRSEPRWPLGPYWHPIKGGREQMDLGYETSDLLLLLGKVMLAPVLSPESAFPGKSLEDKGCNDRRDTRRPRTQYLPFSGYQSI